MSMNRIFGLSLLVMGAAAGALHAEEQATFHLPVEARWGNMNLAPGDYNISLPKASLGVNEFVVRGDDRTGYVLPLVADSTRGASQASYLRLVKVNGTYVITQYQSGSNGKVYNFSVPKQRRHIEMSKQEVLNVDVLGE